MWLLALDFKEPSCATAAVSDHIHLCSNLNCVTHMLSVFLLSDTTLYYLVTLTVEFILVHSLTQPTYIYIYMYIYVLYFLLNTTGRSHLKTPTVICVHYVID